MLFTGDWMSFPSTEKTDGGWKIFVAATLLLILSLQYRLWVGEGSLAENNMLQQRVDQAQVENTVSSHRNRLLMAEIKELKTGLESIEDRARSELGMIREGETFYLLIDEQSQP